MTMDPLDAITTEYLRSIGIPQLRPWTSPFDPGYDLGTLEGHLEQSEHLIASVKISMACWIIADERVTRRKVAAVRKHGLPAVAGGSPFEVAVVQGRLPQYLDLCAAIGFTRIEAGQGFTNVTLRIPEVVQMARERGLEVQFELGSKHDGPFTSEVVSSLVLQGQRWLDAGAVMLVVEARESASAVGLFDAQGCFNSELADRLAAAFGLEAIMFEAPNKVSQFAFLDHFGREVHLCNVRFEELLRVETYRRGLHSDAFSKTKLRPSPPPL